MSFTGAWPAVWAGVDRVYVGGGGSFEPVTRLGEIGVGRLLELLETRLAADSVLFVTAQLWQAWGLPAAQGAQDAQDAVRRELQGAGWSPGRCDTAWISASKGPRWLRVCVLAWAGRDALLGGAVDPDDAVFTLARQAEYRAYLGGPLHTHAGVCGMNSLREDRYLKDRVTWSRPEMWRGCALLDLPRLGNFSYVREPAGPECEGLVMAADRHLDYLAAIGNARVAARPLVRLGRAFVVEDPAALNPGWYLVRWAPSMWDCEVMGPDPVAGCPQDPEQPDGTWMPHTLLEYLMRDRGLPLDVLDAYVTPGRAQGRDVVRLDGWSTPLGRHLTALRREARSPGAARQYRARVMAGVLKASYASGYRMIARPGGRIHRPDWHDAWLGMSRATVLRRTDAIRRAYGLEVLRIDTDCVWYAVPDRATAARLIPRDRVGDGLGQWRVYDPVPYAQYAAAGAQGGAWWRAAAAPAPDGGTLGQGGAAQ
jgi:hypothetical protein